MGADMIVAVVAHKKNAKIDFDAGRAFVKKLKIEDLDIEELVNNGLDESDDTYFDENDQPDLEGILGWLDNAVTEFSGVIYSRYVTSLEIRDLTVYITGGLSWGDVNDECYSIWRVGCVDGLLESMGFATGYWDVEQREVTPDEEAEAIDSIKRSAGA
jgi:hypothetical protein